MNYRRKVKPEKLVYAQSMRKFPTKSEEILWSKLKTKKFNNVKFRRQAIILGYIVDFWCPSHKLVVELDGIFHKGREDYDAQRDRAIQKLGFEVLHIPSKLVFEDLDLVLKTIKNKLFSGEE